MSTLKHGTPNNPPQHLDCGMNYFVDYISPSDTVSDDIKAACARGRVRFSSRTNAQKAAMYAGELDYNPALNTTPAAMYAQVENTTYGAEDLTLAAANPRIVSVSDGVYTAVKRVAAETTLADTSGSVGIDSGAVIGASSADAS